MSELGEFGLIERLAAAVAGGPTAGVEVGIGDDAAVVLPTPHRRLVVTTDAVVEGRHFAAGLSAPEDWGWKAVAVNVSDLAAMGAAPRWLVVALTVPDHLPVAILDRVYAGMAQACRRLDVALVGGDTSGGPVLSLAVTALGEAETVVTRAGARPGDRLVVSGPLGAAAAGLALLQRADAAARALLDRFPALAAAYRRPCPDVAMGRRLARAGASAMLDVSDGLAGDALHLAEASGVGLEVRDADVPLAPGVPEAARLLGTDPVELALAGGEDFVLAAALPPAAVLPPSAALPPPAPGAGIAGVVDCGTFTATPGRRVRRTARGDRPLAGLAYDHFRPRPPGGARAGPPIGQHRQTLTHEER